VSSHETLGRPITHAITTRGTSNHGTNGAIDAVRHHDYHSVLCVSCVAVVGSPEMRHGM